MMRTLQKFTLLGLLLVLLSCGGFGQKNGEPAVGEALVDPTFGPYVSAGLEREGLTSVEVRRAMSRVPRHKFVPEESQDEAYADRAVSIGSGQTISQPYIVALMTERAGITSGSKVLEIGTGSGYQAAVLAELGATVYSIEIIPELASRASKILADLGYSKVHVRQGDGWWGWAEEGPFDAIIVTAASPRMPEKLLQQLGEHGRMVIPIEAEKNDREHLVLIERDGTTFRTKDLGAVRFVPLLGTARESVPHGGFFEELFRGKKPRKISGGGS